jgi:hypothetical protein
MTGLYRIAGEDTYSLQARLTLKSADGQWAMSEMSWHEA